MKDNLVGKTLTLNAGYLSPAFCSATGMILCESFYHTQNRNNKRIASKSEQYYKQMINRYIGFENLDPVSYPAKEAGIIQFKNYQLFIISAIKENYFKK